MTWGQSAEERHEDLLWRERQREVDEFLVGACVRGGGAWCSTHASIWMRDGRTLCGAAVDAYLLREIPDRVVTVGLVPSLRAYAGCLAIVVLPWVLLALVVLVVGELL